MLCPLGARGTGPVWAAGVQTVTAATFSTITSPLGLADGRWDLSSDWQELIWHLPLCSQRGMGHTPAAAPR